MAAKKMYLFFPLDADLLPRIERLKSGQLQTLSRSTLLRRGPCCAEAEKAAESFPAKAGEEAIQDCRQYFPARRPAPNPLFSFG